MSSDAGGRPEERTVKEKELGARMQTGDSVDSLTAPTNEQKVTHTPGPWRVEQWEPDDDDDDEHGLNILHGYGDDCIAQLHQLDGEISPQLEADARLIAAAPNLLAALKFAITVDDEMWRDLGETPKRSPEYQESYELALKAIAKAEGR